MSVGSDGALWVTRTTNAVSGAPLCHVTDGAMKCFGKSDGMPISESDALLPDGSGGFWLGGQTALVHWHAGVSEIYPIEALKSNVGDSGIVSLARGARWGSLGWHRGGGAGTRAWAIQGRSCQTICDAHL